MALTMPFSMFSADARPFGAYPVFMPVSMRNTRSPNRRPVFFFASYAEGIKQTITHFQEHHRFIVREPIRGKPQKAVIHSGRTGNVHCFDCCRIACPFHARTLAPC